MSVMSMPAGATPQRAIKTRRMKFNYAPGRVDRHYANNDLIMSHVVAILSAMFPEGEDFFVRFGGVTTPTVITDPELQGSSSRGSPARRRMTAVSTAR